MGFMEIFGFIAMLFGIVLFIRFIIIVIFKINYLKNTDNRIRVKRQSMGLYYGWLVISPINVVNMFMQMSTTSEIGNLSREKAYLHIGIFWIMMTAHWLVYVIFARYAYISENYLITHDVDRIKLNHDNCKYRISGDILEIYYKKNKVPYRYLITEKREELLKILNENYKPYEKEAEN